MVQFRFGVPDLAEGFLPDLKLLQQPAQVYVGSSCGATSFIPQLPRGFPYSSIDSQSSSPYRPTTMSNIQDIEPYAAPVRPGNERSLSELEKATVSHVEHRGKGADALNDSALMAGERTEKVNF